MTESDDPSAWAEQVLAEALDLARTRLKAIRTDEKLEVQVLDAIVVVAEAKALRYAGNHSGTMRAVDASPALLGWVDRNRRLAQALHTLVSVGVDVNDVPMLPKEYL